MLYIVKYPDPFLRQKSIAVEEFNQELHHFLDEMYEIMITKNGVGLAAIQVGVAKRILIVNIPDQNNEQLKENLLEVINPEIIEQSGEISFSEGCLSIPDFYEDVTRFNHIKVRYQNRLGEFKELEAEGYLAVAIQHEIDHLNGVLFIDRLSIMKRKKFEKLYKKQQRCSA